MRSQLSVIMYHYVRDSKKSNFPNLKSLEFSLFKKQLNFLEKKYNIISYKDILNYVNNNKNIPNNACLLTFDDGYKDHYKYVFPELKKRNLKAIFFPVVSTIIENKVMSPNKIQFILCNAPSISLIIKDIKILFKKYNLEKITKKNFNFYWKKFSVKRRYDSKKVSFIKNFLQKGLDNKFLLIMLNNLFSKYVSKNEKKFAKNLYLNKNQIVKMIKSGMYFGVHGYNHIWMENYPKKIQEKEINRSLKFLKQVGISKKNWVMCYPWGSYNKNTLKILKNKKCLAAFTTKIKIATLKKSNNFELSRIDTNDIGISL